MATKYRLTVYIEESLLPSYNNKTEPYTLCIAKKVGEDYNVVFQCRSKFLRPEIRCKHPLIRV